MAYDDNPFRKKNKGVFKKDVLRTKVDLREALETSEFDRLSKVKEKLESQGKTYLGRNAQLVKTHQKYQSRESSPKQKTTGIKKATFLPQKN